MGEKKYLFTKTCKCYKAITFLWKNDLARVYFNMKQTLRVFLSKVWKSEGYLEPSRASLMKFISENSERVLALNYFCKKTLSKMFGKVLGAPLAMVKPRSSFPFFKINYLADNIIMTVFVSLKNLSGILP